MIMIVVDNGFFRCYNENANMKGEAKAPVKKRTLQILEENRGRPVSGSYIAEKLGVTRAAVWKNIKLLRAEGYMISAVTNQGYCLSGNNDILSEEGIRPYLYTKVLGRGIKVFDSVGSTNAVAKEMAASGAPEGLVVIAEEQTGGRGRLGRHFFSPKGTGIYMSILLRPKLKPEDASLITVCAAVAAAEAIEMLTGVPVQIKWVNDLYVGGKKVCGILTEASMEMESGGLNHMVVGIGINVSSPEGGFPQELREIAGSVTAREDVKKLFRCALIAEVLNRLEPYSGTLLDSHVLTEYRKRSCVIGREVDVLSFNGQREWAKVLDIDEKARLIVCDKEGNIRALGAGEISIRPRA